MTNNIAIVMDCGATNVRTVAIDDNGKILAMKSYPNNTQPDPENSNMIIWDAKEIWGKLCKASKEVISEIDKSKIKAVTVTTFGVDGAPVDKNGNMLNPIISWKCSRTNKIMEEIDKYYPLNDLYIKTGVQPASYNTINKLIWLKENKPEVFEKGNSWLFISSLFLYFLSGEKVTDRTMAGTSMMTDFITGEFADDILDSIGVDKDFFPKMANAGDVIGRVTDNAMEKTGIPAGVPVVSAGHDTQFAVYGSGAGVSELVLSSGTWEVLMVRSKTSMFTLDSMTGGITTELDAVKGICDIGVNALASGIIEWIKKYFYSGDIPWDVIIAEASKEPAGSNGVFMHPNFFTATGVLGETKGTIFGLELGTSRGSVFRATLEALSFQTRKNMEMLEEAGRFKANKMIVVGGGSKNMLWNQIRANVTGLPVHLISQKETTVLGAALFAFAGVGIYSSPEEARKKIDYNPIIIEPQQSDIYTKFYERFLKLESKLKDIYTL